MTRFLLNILAMLSATASLCAATHNFATYNIRYNAGGDTGGKNWEHRGPAVRDVVLNYDLDIVGFQEVCGPGNSYRNPATGRTQLDDLKAWLPDYDIHSWDRDGTAAKEHMVTAYKKSRYELIDKGHFFISATPDTYSKGWDTLVETHPRVLGWLKLKDKETGQLFVYATTHTNDGWSLDGPYGSQLVSKRMREIAGDLPVMVVADYNTNRNNPDAVKGLKAYHAAFYDAALEVPEKSNYSLPVTNPKVTWTYNAYHPASDLTYKGSEIDYQFYRGMKILERHIVTEEFTYEGKQFPSSDHFPIYVVAELSPIKAKQIYVDCNAGDGGDGTISNPFRTISQAIAISEIDDTINIAAGVYNESVNPKYTVTLVGGYDRSFTRTEGTTTISGEGLDSSPVYSPGYNSLYLKNLVISGYKSKEQNKDGAVMFRGSELNMENVIVENNSAISYGGGLCVLNASNMTNCESNRIYLKNCIFRNNTAVDGGGAAISAYSIMDIDGCDFSDNTATKSGGALYMTFGTPVDKKIWFTRAEALITGSSFINNSAKTQGAIMIHNSMSHNKISMVNCTISGNTLISNGGLPNVVKKYGGAAIYATLADGFTNYLTTRNTSLNIGHCTIVGNSATCVNPTNYLASAINVDGSDVRLMNNIIAANYSNGANAKGDITLRSDAPVTDKNNTFGSIDGLSFTASTASNVSPSFDETLNSLSALMNGTVSDGTFKPEYDRGETNNSRYIKLKSTKYGATELATLIPLQRALETEFLMDLNRNGVASNQLTTDQLGRDRNNKSMPGAIEFFEGESGIKNMTTGRNETVHVNMLPGGGVELLSDTPLGHISAIDPSGKFVYNTECKENHIVLDFSQFSRGVYILKYRDDSVKILN